MIEDDKHQDLSKLTTPQPINIKLDYDADGHWVTLVKGDQAICKFNTEDTDTLFTAVRLLSGLLSADCIQSEIVDIRNLLLEVVGS
tara:strand:+ start:143 stop:400 length:258 start_codon:yes stop_codon:yes gene_type:complete